MGGVKILEVDDARTRARFGVTEEAQMVRVMLH